ncbi:MAG: DUF58 domain-containing protein [Egibacteraceae bacterium]
MTGWLPVPTWRLAALAAVLAVVVAIAPFGARTSLLAVNVALVAAAAVDWARAPRPARLEVGRDLPGVVALDGAVDVRWSVANPTGRPVRVRLADQLAPSLRAEARTARLTVPARGRGQEATRLHPSRRGRFTPTTLTVRVEGPWGLVARQADRHVPGELRVYPPFRSREEAELRITRARILDVGLRSAAGRGGGTEFDQLREYTIDDEFGRIDWAATARVGKPIVRSYRAERNQTVLCLLDTGRVMAGRVRVPESAQRDPGGGPDAGIPRLEHAMDAVMMLTAVSTRLGDRAGLVAFADTVRSVVAPGQRRDQLGRVTAAMYDLDPRLAESDYRGAFAETLARFRRRALLVVLTELAEQAVAETLLPALPLIVRDHVVLVAAVRDPDVDRWAHATPAGAGAAYRKAAAVQSLDARRRTVARLRGLGAVVVDATPGRLAPELADAYLHVKATARL